MTICNENDSRIENILRKAIIVIVVIAFIFPLITPRAFAASSVTISGGDNVKGGDTFTVAVTYGGGSVGRVDAQMTYDTSKLTYISGGSSSGNSGYIQLKKAGTGEAITFNIKFQALSEGTADLSVITNEMYDLNEAAMDNPSTSKSISITGSAGEGDLITQTTSPDQPVDSTKAKGVDERPESKVNSTMVLIIAAAIVAVLIAIIAAVLICKRKKDSKPSADSDTEKRNAEVIEEDLQDDYLNDSYEATNEVRSEDVKYDSSGNIARRSQMSKNKASKKKGSKNKDSKDKVAGKKYSNEETERWEDWDGWDDDMK